MVRPNLLLVDADPRSLRVLEVSLRKGGFTVATCGSAEEALELMRVSRPDLVVSDTKLPRGDGFSLARRVREGDLGADIPFMFLSGDSSAESRVRALEAGVEDYLTKPAYIKEIVSRIETLLQRVTQQRLESQTPGTTRQRGSLSETPLVDLLQMVTQGKRSGALYLSRGDERATLYFLDGALQDAELAGLRGEAAVHRTLLWSDGVYELDFRPVRPERRITRPLSDVLEEGMRRVDEWERLREQLPDLDAVFEVNDAELLERLPEIPDAVNDVLRQLDGKRSVQAVVDATDRDDLEVLNTVCKLYFEGLLHEAGQGAGRTLRPPATAPAPQATTATEGVPRGDATTRRPVPHDTLVPAPSQVPAETDAGEASSDGNVLDFPMASRAPSRPAGRPSQLGSGKKRPNRRRKRLSMMTSPGMLSSSGSLAAPPPEEGASPGAQAGPDGMGQATRPVDTHVASSHGPKDESAQAADETDQEAGEPVEATQGATSPTSEDAQASEDTQASEDAQTNEDAQTSGAWTADDEAREPEQAGEDDDERWLAETLPPSVTGRRRVPAAVAGGVLVLLTVLAVRFSSDDDPAEERRNERATQNEPLAEPAASAGPGPAPAETAEIETAEAEEVNNAGATAGATATNEAPAGEGDIAEAAANDPLGTPGDPPEVSQTDPAAETLGDSGNVAETVENPPPPAPMDDPALLEQVGAAKKLMARGRHKQAQTVLTGVLAEAPNFAPALSQLGMSYLNVGKHAEAADHATRAVTVDPTSSEGWIVLGAARHASRDYAGAREAYRQCVELGKGPYVRECRRMRR